MSYEKFVKGVVWRVGFETKIRFENDGDSTISTMLCV